MVTEANAPVQDGPVGSYRATRSPVGGFRIEITVTHRGTVPLVDFYQLTMVDLESALLHPHEAPEPFRACPGVGAPGWTCVGIGLAPGESVGPFVAWCAKAPERFSMRWCAEDPSMGGTFEIRSV
ncbi:hypothetical protein EON82_17030 [bacterium]|nr:MAG: hypothetical protein EON82_17030 [bacterium]